MSPFFACHSRWCGSSNWVNSGELLCLLFSAWGDCKFQNTRRPCCNQLHTNEISSVCIASIVRLKYLANVDLDDATCMSWPLPQQVRPLLIIANVPQILWQILRFGPWWRRTWASYAHALQRFRVCSVISVPPLYIQKLQDLTTSRRLSRSHLMEVRMSFKVTPNTQRDQDQGNLWRVNTILQTQRSTSSLWTLFGCRLMCMWQWMNTLSLRCGKTLYLKFEILNDSSTLHRLGVEDEGKINSLIKDIWKVVLLGVALEFWLWFWFFHFSISIFFLIRYPDFIVQIKRIISSGTVEPMYFRATVRLKTSAHIYGFGNLHACT